MSAPERVVPVMLRRHRCVACGRSWSSKQRAIRHAKDCRHDPANRACSTCEHDYLDSYDGPLCEIGKKPEGVLCVRHCEFWEPKK